MSSDALYQDAILDHARHPRHRGVLPGASHFAHGHSPLCGDKISVYLRLNGERIEEAGFEGSGCAICIASASMMTEVLTGKTTEQGEALCDAFKSSLTSGAAPPEPAQLASLAALHAYPSRIKCAALAWDTFKSAL